jgi:subtilase-type serine protease
MRRLVRHVSTQSAQRSTTSTGNDFWISVNQTDQTAKGNAHSARATLRGTEIAGGHDADLGDGWLGGFAFRFGNSRQDVSHRRSDADVTTGTAAFYGGREIPHGSDTLRFLLSGALTRHEVESKRRVGIDPRTGKLLDQKLEASYAGTSFVGAAEAAYRMSPAENYFVEPYASLGWHHLRVDGFKEKGGSADGSVALRKGGESENHATSTLGVRLSTSSKARVTLDADLGWQHLYGKDRSQSVFTFREGEPGKFSTSGASLNKDAALVGLSVGMKLSDNAKVRFQYDGELGSRGKSHGGQVVFEMKW